MTLVKLSRYGLLLFLTGIIFSGCASGLPQNAHCLQDRSYAIPPDAAPVFSWHAARTDLKTFWGDQSVSIDVACWLPEGNAADTRWYVRAENGDGVAVPFLGFEHRYINENGTEVCVLTPAVDLSELGDGLYVTLIPNVREKNGKIISLQPTAALSEIRAHSFRPFRVKFPLMPDWKDPLTPAPDQAPATPFGTPIPLALD